MVAQKRAVRHVPILVEDIARKLKPAQAWRDALRANAAAALGGILGWIQGCGVVDSGLQMSAEGPASRVDLIATAGVTTALKGLAQCEEPVATRLVIESVAEKPRDLDDSSRAFHFGKGSSEVTVLVDPVDGTTNLRDGRVFDVATVAAASAPRTVGEMPTFADVTAAMTCFLGMSSDLNVVVCGVLATPTGLWDVQVDPLTGRLLHLSALDPTPRKFQEMVFASYRVVDPRLRQLEAKLAAAGYPLFHGCGASALDCLRVLRLERGAYVDLRARLESSGYRLNTYDIAAVPLTAAAFAKTTGTNISVHTADLKDAVLRKNHIARLPLTIAPLCLVLTKDIDEQPLLELLR